MEQSSLLAEGTNLLMLGMGFVFVFLVFLVFATTLMSKIVTRFSPPPAPKAAKKTVAPKSANDDQLIAVLAAVAHHHKVSTN